MTEGLPHVLKNAVQRLTGNGGDPVIELMTNFGGGKTHTMLALYHLFSGARSSDLAGVDALLAEAGSKEVPKAKRAVFVGTIDSNAAETYWGPHILGALDDDHEYLGGSMSTMQDTIDALR